MASAGSNSNAEFSESSSFFAVFAPEVSRVLQPLAIKTSGLAIEPVQWRGGRVAKFYKGKGKVIEKDNSRVILCADIPGKSLQAVVRSKSIDFSADYFGASQFGGRKGLGVDFASHAVKSFHDYCEDQGVSASLIFLDVMKAYYSAIRELILHMALAMTLSRM